MFAHRHCPGLLRFAHWHCPGLLCSAHRHCPGLLRSAHWHCDWLYGQLCGEYRSGIVRNYVQNYKRWCSRKQYKVFINFVVKIPLQLVIICISDLCLIGRCVKIWTWLVHLIILCRKQDQVLSRILCWSFDGYLNDYWCVCIGVYPKIFKWFFR